MSNVEFEEAGINNKSAINSQYMATSNHEPKMVRWVKKSGLAKTDKQATSILVGIALLGIVVAVGLFIYNNNLNSISADDPRYKLSEETISKFSPELQEQIRNNQK